MDPYEILGASRADSDDVIRSKYRELVKKYHPDSYANNPLADLAAEKMKDINGAYDAIMRERSGQTPNNAHQPHPGSGAGANHAYRAVREFINRGDYINAERLLAGMQSRDAEWHFLYACVCYSRGWFNDASSHFSTACRLDPANAEYAAAMNNMNTQRQNYHQAGRQTTTGRELGCGPLECCSTLMCIDCCCRLGI